MEAGPTAGGDAAARFGSGRAVARIEDRELLLGRGRFTDNARQAGELQLAFLRSPHAHARIVRIDVEAARAMPGVAAVYTGADLAAAGVKAMPLNANWKPAAGGAISPPRLALAEGEVRFVGEAVAAVAAATRDEAKDALEQIVIDYDDLPVASAVVDAVAAAATGESLRLAAVADRVCADVRHGDAAAVEAAFAAAARRVALDLVNQRLAAAPLEPRSVVASTTAGVEGAAGRIEIRISNQMPTAVAGGVSAALPGLGKADVRVVVGDVGGGFGMKTGIYPEDLVVAHAARSLGRPVRWQAERSEDFVAATHGRDVTTHAELALDANGRVLALRVRSLADVGAYATGTGVAIQLLIGPWVSTSVYDIPSIDLHLQAVLSNTAPTGAYRGAGRPEAIYIVERLMDAAARELGLDPAELRRRNMIRPEQMPYRNAIGQTYDGGAFARVLDRGLALADWSGFAARRAETESRGLLRGRGIATFLEWTGGNAFEETVTVDVTADGYIEIFSATQQMGQGIRTSYAQLAVDVFDVPIEKVRIVQGDTDRGNGFGSAGSRSLFTGGSSLVVGCQRTVEHSKALAGEALEAAPADIEYRAGRFTVAGTDLGIDLFALAGRQAEARIHLDSTSSVGGPTWPNGCHVCEVEVDPDTGEVRLASYASVNDIGRVVSPKVAEGQVDGGAVQGIGQALCEAVRYDAESGQLLTGSFMDYAMPRAAEGIVFETQFDESSPCALNPLGVKGVGELGTIGATPAVMNAVVDALDHAGLGRAAEALQMPATAEKVWRLLESRR